MPDVLFAALAACRFVHYAAALWLFGASVYVWMLAPSELAARLAPPTWQGARAAAATIVVSALVWLSLQAGSMGDGWIDTVRPETLAAVLFETDFGAAWQVHGVLCIVTAAAVLARRPRLTCISSGVALASLGLVGHAAMHGDTLGWLHRANLAVHLLAGGFWLGGLGPLIATMRSADASGMPPASITAMRRFSLVGHAAVVAVVLTGFANAVLILHGNPFGWASPYRALLTAKMLVVAAMVMLALVNRYRIVPRLRSRPDTARLLIRNSIAEIWLALVAIALVACFGLLDPHA